MHKTSDPLIKLYAFPTSPYAIKVGCFLVCKNIDYQFVGVSPITFKQIKFTGKRQVPVLQIGDEWKLESSEICRWIDELFPEIPMLGNSTKHREQIADLDDWVSHRMIPLMFRLVVDWPSVRVGLTNGWKLARAVNDATSLPAWVRLMWPILIRKAKFIVVMVEALDRSKPLSESHEEIIDEFVGLLGKGPYLGENNSPSLADVSAYGVIVFAHRLGLKGDAHWLENEKVLTWIKAVQSHLPENPFLVSDNLLIRDLPD